MTFEERVKAKALERQKAVQDEYTKRKKALQEKKNIIFEKYSKNVAKLLDMMTSIYENDEVFYKQLQDRFASDCWSHKLGFIGADVIGYVAGGACGEVPFMFNKKEILFDEEPKASWSASKLSDFDEDFPKFEQNVLKAIKREYGDDLEY